MTAQLIELTPEDIEILIQCPLHYHFYRQDADTLSSPNRQLERLVRESIHNLHAQGGPSRVSLRRCLAPIQHHRKAQKMVEQYYLRLRQDWASIMAGNEALDLKITIGGVPLLLHGTVDRLNKTSDGGILAVLIRTQKPASPEQSRRRNSPALTIYHALVAAAYPLKRPVRIQELWLHNNQETTIELSEAEYRHNLGRLREPAQDLARGQVRARPGLHCDHCPYKHHGCPVYVHDDTGDDSPLPDDNVQPRQWLFEI